LTSDPQILKVLKGFNVDFVDCPPVQMLPSKEIAFNSEESQIIRLELDKLLKKESLGNHSTVMKNFSLIYFFVKRRLEGIGSSSI